MTSTAPPDSALALRNAGLRVTAPRIAVLDAVATHPHTGVDTILGAARERLGSLSTQAAYDVLAALVGAGLARRIEPAGSPARYETRTGDNHHHLVCRRCGRIEDVDCAVGEAPCLEPSQAHGYVLDEAEVTFWGECAGCAGIPIASVSKQPTTQVRTRRQA